MMNALLKSPKTSFGALLITVGGVGGQITANQTWAHIVLMIGAAVIGMFARDSDVSSEIANAKTTPSVEVKA